eukprot:scaffold52681_cov37-Tisochrysis_lutea.AAC.4
MAQPYKSSWHATWKRLRVYNVHSTEEQWHHVPPTRDGKDANYLEGRKSSLITSWGAERKKPNGNVSMADENATRRV